MNGLLNYIKNSTSINYDVNNYNCTDFGMACAKISGIKLGTAYGKWGNKDHGYGGGDNPGQLGQNIRKIPINPNMVKNTNGGNSPKHEGSYN